jgi:hypothetical protein
MTTPQQETDIIKNSHREKDNIQASYTPEYKRLKVNPILQDFSAIDGELVTPLTTEDEPLQVSKDNSQFVTNSHILDNNESVSYGFGMKLSPSQNTESPNIGEFVLMVSGEVISHGSHEYILSEAKSILYREHPDFLDKKVQISDVIILKRIGLKIGVFLDE